MILYKHCKVYFKGDKDKNAIGFVDIISNTALFVDAGYDRSVASGGQQYNVTIKTSLDLIPYNHGILIDGLGDFIILSFSKTLINVGNLRKKYKYLLNLG